MNLNFIEKEFDKLARIEEYINYEYEPKSNIKLGKRNIYFEDIKLDFMNEVNTYGFSPFIFESYVEQRDDPNIMKFMTKKFNHGLTNYVKIQTRGLTSHSSKNNKQMLLSKTKLKKGKQKIKNKEEQTSNIFLVKRSEKSSKNDNKENFLQKALVGVGGHKLNLSFDNEDGGLSKDNNDKDKDKKTSKKDNKDTKKEEKKVKFNEKEEDKNKELLDQIIGLSNERLGGKNSIFPNLFVPSPENSNNQGIFKHLFKNKPSNLDSNKKILTLSKNRYLLGDKKNNNTLRAFSPLSSQKFKGRSGSVMHNELGYKLGNRLLSTQKSSASQKNLNEKEDQKRRDSYLLLKKSTQYKIIYAKNKQKKN